MSGIRAVPAIARVDLAAQRAALRAELAGAVDRVLESGIFVLGPEVAAFEAEFAAFCGAGHCATTGSGTDALRLVLSALGIGPGDEVVTVSLTAAPTAFAVEATGATPVFVDVDPGTYTMDPDAAAEAIGPATRALLPVHLYGQCADLDPLRDIAEEHGLWLLEDACQAHGATYRGRRAGTVGHAGCFSFYPTKNLGAYGDGGAVVTDDADLADRVRLLRNHGQSAGYVHETPATNSRLDELQAALLRAKLPHLDRWNAARRRIAAAYEDALRGLPLVLPTAAEWGEHVFHLYVVRADRRDDLVRLLGERGVEAGVHYPLPVHRQPAYEQSAAAARLPVTERVAAEVVSLPMYPELTDEQQSAVAAALREVLAEAGA